MHNLVVAPDELKKWRTRRRLSQTELGELLGVNLMTVYRWEAGVCRIPPFLHLALRCLEREGGGGEVRGEKTKKERR